LLVAELEVRPENWLRIMDTRFEIRRGGQLEV
jgi:hypothetical protein